MTLQQSINLTLSKLDLQARGTFIKSLAIVVKDDAVRNFVDEGFGGNKWIPKKVSNGKKTLRDKGDLLQDVRDSVKNGHQNAPMQYTLHVKTPYAGYHQDGTEKMPQREFIGMNSRLEVKLNQRVTELINKTFTYTGTK
jgi:phage gpG-like protein